MLSQVINTLIRSANQAADDVLLEALDLGTDSEKSLVLGALVKRGTVRGLRGVIRRAATLSEALLAPLVESIRAFQPALRECGRSDDRDERLGAIRLVDLGRQGRLTYLLSDSLNGSDEVLQRAAVEALVSLARWASGSTTPQAIDDQIEPTGRMLVEALMQGDTEAAATEARPAATGLSRRSASEAERVAAERPDIEAAVARALDVHRGKLTNDLALAALLLADHPHSKTLAILMTPKHGGQAPMIRRLQGPPDPQLIDALFQACARGGLRAHFPAIFAQATDPAVLDALLARTHRLKDQALLLCTRQAMRGGWCGLADLEADLDRRGESQAGAESQAARIVEWIGAFGLHELAQDERLVAIRGRFPGGLEVRLAILRVLGRRGRHAPVKPLLAALMSDPDERVARMAVREVIRRRPPDWENLLIQRMTEAPESVRRLISRTVGRSGFEQFWTRFDRLDRTTRRSAGRAMFKLLPDAIGRLARLMGAGPIEQRVKAIQVAQELDLCGQLTEPLMLLTRDANPRLRSKAVAALGSVEQVPADELLGRALQDADARVRANAVEILEARRQTQYVPLLAHRARGGHNRERANAIKAMHRMRVSTASSQLLAMLRDERPEHRISGMWALRQIGWWQLLREIGQMAKADPVPRVRRYALNVLRGAVEVLAAEQARGPEPHKKTA